MKQFFYTRKSKLLLFMLLAFFAGGVSPTWAATTETFDEWGNTIHDGWSVLGGATYGTSYGYTYIVNGDYKRGSSGKALYSDQSSSTGTTYIITPKLSAGTNVSFYFRKKGTGSSTKGYIRIYNYDESKGTVGSSQLWGCWPNGSNEATSNYTASGNISVGESDTRFAIYIANAVIDDFTYTAAATSISGPAFVVKDGSTKLTSPYAYNFGLTTAGTTKVFKLSNPGTAATPIELSATGNVGASIGEATSIAAGGEVTLTLTMPDANASGTVTVTPTGAGLSAFTFNVSGTLRDPNKVYEALTSGSLPEDWTATSWTATSGYVSTNAWYQSSNARLITPKLNIKSGEKIMFEAIGTYPSDASYQTMVVEYSTDKSSWTASEVSITLTSDWQTVEIDDIPVGSYYIAIHASQARVRNYYGGELPLEPKMVVTQPATLDFGLYEKDASPAPTKTFTIANTGTATLNGISVTSANAAFTITNAPTSLAAGESQDVTITMATGTTGALSSLITVSATDMTNATFTVTGCVKPAGMAVEDFSGTTIPSGWTSSGSWSFATDGVAIGTSGSAYLYTPKLHFSAGDFIVIKAKNSDGDASDYITISGSVNEGSDNYAAYSKKITVANSSDYATFVVTDIPTTVNKIRFTGGWVIVDEIYGLTYAPQLAVTTGDPAAPVTTPANYNFGETTANATVTYNFANSGSGTINITNVAITGEGAATYSTNFDSENKPAVTSGSPFNLVITRTYDSSRAGAAAMEAVVTVTTSEGDFIINVTGTDKAANDPEFAIFIGETEQTTGANLGFGTITSNTTKTFIIKNDGTGALNVTSIALPDADYSTDLESAPSTESPLVIAAGGSKTVNVTLAASAKAIKTGNIVISATGFDDFSFKADAYVLAGTETATFESLPTNWTNTGWTISGGEATADTYVTPYPCLTTAKLVCEEGDFIVVTAKKYDNDAGDYIQIQYSTDNGLNWTDLQKLDDTTLPTNSKGYKDIVVSGIPVGTNRLRFQGFYARIKQIAGLTYSANDPAIAVKNAENADVASGTTKDFGWAQTAQSATYKISNSGTGTLTISNISAPDGFTATTAGDVMTVAAGADPLVLTVTMTNAAIGAKSGTVTLTTDGGNFTIPVKGFVYGDRNLVDFTDATQYTGWTDVNVTDNVASLSSTAIETTPFAATAGEKLYVEIKGNSSYTTHSFSYSYSRDGGANWSDATALVASTYSSVPDQVFTITDIADAEAASTVLIRFTGAGLGINRIYGFEALTAPVMTLDKTADYNFGMQTAAAEYVITVTNTGTATLNNLAAALTTGTNYAVAITKPDGESTTTISAGKATVPAGQQAIITVTQLFDANNGLASLSDVLTISGDDVASEEIALSGKTRDGNKWYVDFASGIPSSFVEKGNWTTYSGSAYVPYNSKATPSALTSQTITLAAGEKLQFDTKLYSAGGTLKVRHSLNGGLSWSDYTDFDLTSEWVTKYYDLENVASTVAMIEFLSYYAYVDNIYGGTLNNEAPMIQVKKGSTIVKNGEATEAFGTIASKATATYTITNIGNGTLTITSPITTVTGGASATINETSLGAGESATLTITLPVEAPYGEKSGAVTINTSLGDFVINYTATTMDPNVLAEQFASGKPAGWYFGGYWEIESQIAQNTASAVSDLITEQLAVSGTSDVLTFQVKKSGNSTPTFKVYTSQDRVTWNEVDLSSLTLTTSYQDVNISGLAAGDYYVKISGARVMVDNFLGWEKKNNTRDLYVTATTFPTATQNAEASVNISATVTSLIAAEEGVYAKLFVDDDVKLTADAQDIALNGTKTFSFTYTMPTTAGTHKAQIKVYYSDDTEAFATAENDLKVYYTMDETEDPSTITAGTYDVMLNHSFVEGWNTVCLPFDVEVSTFNSITKDAVAYSFDNYDEGTKALTFNKVTETTLEAGTPYVIYVPAAITSTLTFQNADVKATTAGKSVHGDVTFQGTYAPMIAGSLTDCCGLTAAGKIVKAKSTTTMKGFRGYFKNVPAGARVMFNGFEDDETTGIRMITIDNTAAEGTFNLQGQKVEQLKKGRLYIINGKKQVVK